MERLLTFTFDILITISNINRGKNNAKGHVLGWSVLHILRCPPTKKGDVRTFARLCTFVHACNPPISEVPPGFPQLPVITESNLQFSSAPLTSKYGKLEFWQYSGIPLRQFSSKRIIKQCPLQCIIQHLVILCRDEIRQIPEVGSFQNDQMHNSDFCTAQPLILSHGLRPLGLLHLFTR